MNANIHTAEVLPPRALLFLGIVALHVVFGWFLTSGLMRTTMELLLPTRPIDIVPVEEKKPPLEKIPIEEPRFVREFAVPKPEVFDIPDVEEPVINTVIEEPDDPRPIRETSSTAVAEPPIRLIGHNVLPNADKFYPPGKIRTGEEGSAVVRACVNENGMLMDGAPVVETSSGSADFDRAALRVAREGKYARSMRGDTPVPNCHRFRVVFSLH
jgi:TonB family protein